ncbi:unnamed protein product [Ilex paraguariensis]|uniref:PB1-like domain-containing protein n=2 Tax=Ilex paraguariensis TaxID=185542 RepID=A0ABC8TIL2_9AQUA
MEVHHSGEFREKPNKVYVGGQMDYIDDLMLLIEMDDIAFILGYAPYIGYYYRIPDGIKLVENHQVDGDFSVDKGKRVASECDELDSEYQPDFESSEYDMLVDSDYESEYDDMLYDSYVDKEAEWTGLKSNRLKETETDKGQ